MPQTESLRESLDAGDYLLFWSRRLDSSTGNDEPYAAYAIKADGAKFGPVLPEPQDAQGLAFSMDGIRFAYYDLAEELLAIGNTSDGEVRFLPGTSGCESPTWSPDGTKIACSLDDVVVLDLLNGQAARVTQCSEEDTDPPPVCDGPVWSPDGEKIAYLQWTALGEDEGYGLYLLSLSCLDEPEGCRGAAEGPIGNASDYTWSPDGEELVALIGTSLESYNLSSGNWRSLGRIEDYHSGLSLSPSGDLLAFVYGGDLYIFPLAGGQPSMLLEDGSAEIIGWIQVAGG